MAYNPLNPNGQATMANSSPVVIASDQSAINTTSAQAAATTGNLTTASGAGSTVSANVSQYSVATITLKGTYAGVTVSFKASDDNGTTYYAIEASNSSSPNSASTSFTLTDNSSNMFNVTVPGVTNVEVVCTAITSGTVVTRITPTADPMVFNVAAGLVAGTNIVGKVGIDQTTPGTTNGVSITNASIAVTNAGVFAVQNTASIPAGANIIGQIELTDGTNIANVMAGDTGFNGAVTANSTKTTTFTTSGAGAQVIGPIDCRGFNTITISSTANSTAGLVQACQTSSTSGGTYNTSFTFIDSSTAGSTPAALGSTSGHTYVSEVFDNFLRINVTALTSGTWSGTVTLSNKTMSYPTVAVTQSGNFTFGVQSNNITGTITTSSSSIATSSTSVNSGFAVISTHGTYAGISFGITVSDDTGTDYYSTAIFDVAANQWLAPGSTITPGTNASKIYYVPVFPNACAVRVLASAYTSGTANIKISLGQGITPGSTMSQIMDAAGNNRGTNVTSGNSLQTDTTSIAGTAVVNGGLAGSQSVGGTVATNVAITDNPLNLGAQAITSENTAVTATRKVQLVADAVGKIINLPYANPENIVSGVISSAMTGTTSTSCIAAPASGLRNYITTIIVSNSHATVGTDILIQDGSGGTTLGVIPAAAVYGGATVAFTVAIRQPTTATAIYFANVTTGSNTKVSAYGYKGA